MPIAATDAEAVAAALKDPAVCGYPAEQVTLLTDESATREGVLSALAGLSARLTAESTLLVFYVGHGVYGTEGTYNLSTHDSELKGARLKEGTGVRDAELIAALRAIKAARVLLLFNSCHSGELAPSFAPGEGLDAAAPPEEVRTALLSTGEGRITITACRSEQLSWVGRGALSIFTQAVVSGLRGGAPNNHGYISVFGLYESVYFAAKEAAAALGKVQEPVLTVIKGVGPFPVALYRGASEPGAFEATEPVPAETAVHEVSAESSRRLGGRYKVNTVTIGGSVTHSIVLSGDGNKIEVKR